MSSTLAMARAEESRSVFGFAGDFRYPHVMRKTHQHQEVELNYLLEGTIVYLFGDQFATVPARRLTLLWAAVPHQIIANHGARKFYWFTLPFAWVLQWRLPDWCLATLLGGRLLVDAVTDETDAANCRRWKMDLDERHPEGLRIAQLEIEARVRRMLRRQPAALPAARARHHLELTPAGARHVQQMAEVISRHYTEKLSVEDIVRPTGLHPNYAMRLFRANCGRSLVDYLVRQRLFHAHRLLLTTDRKIADIAYASGFGSLSRFNEAFKRAYGCAPSAYPGRFNSDPAAAQPDRRKAAEG